MIKEEDIHPDLMTSLTIIGASLSFANDNWDQFSKAMEFSDIDEKMRELMHKQLQHLMDDIGAHITRQELIENVMQSLGKVLGL